MILKSFLSIFCLFIGLVASLQPRMELRVNGKEVQLTPYVKLAKADIVEVLIHLPSKISAERFIQNAVMKVCQYTQNQNQEQRTRDRFIDLDKLAEALSKKKIKTDKVIERNISENYIRISFKGDITSCTNQFFWLTLTVPSEYIPSVNQIKNFKYKIRFKRKNE